jgi:putative FmdB family regulatory protein
VPTYQYSCTDCGHFLEAYQGFTDDALTECPECGGRLRKVFNAVGVVFKGSGFYRTDSRGKANGESASAGANGAKDSAASSDSSSTSNGSSGSNGSTGSTGSSTSTTSSTPATAGS